MNDTATAALKAGRLLVGTNDAEDRLCGMHVVELVINHASGYIERKKKKVVVDSFPECLALKDKVRAMAKQFADRKAKGRIEKFNAFCDKHMAFTPIKMPLPNKTRVAGNFRMFEAALRLHHAIVQFVLHNRTKLQMGQKLDKDYDEKVFLTADEWQQLAEYSTFYDKTTSLAIALQSDMAGSLSIAKLQLTACLVELAGTPTVDRDGEYEYTPFRLNDKQVVFDVVKVNDNETTWTSKSTFHELPRRKMCLPLKVPGPGQPDVEDNRMWNVDGNDVLLPTMSQDSRKLIKRIMKEMESYFKKTTDDEKVCMFLNPFVKVFGIMHLSDMRFFGATFETECKNLTIQELHSLFGPDTDDIKAQVEKEHNETMEKLKEQSQTPAQGVGPASPLRASAVTATSLAYKHMRRKFSMATAPTTTGFANMSLHDKQQRRVVEETAQYREDVKRQVADYEAHLVSLMEVGEDKQTSNEKWMKLLQQFPSPLAKEEMELHGERVMDLWDAHDCPFDAIYATKRFNMLGWWLDEKHGGKWTLLQSLAVVHLGQPYTNAAVERAFSRSTWVDAARAQKVLDSTFEMRVLDANNRDLVESAKPLLDKKKAFRESSSAVSEVVQRFAIPLDDENEEYKKDSTETATDVLDNDDDEISVIADAGTQDNEDESESDDMATQDDDSTNEPLNISEVNALLQSKNKAKKKAPLKAPPSSTKKNPPSKKQTKKRK